MVGAVALLLSISAEGFGDSQERTISNHLRDDDQERMIFNTDHSGQCVYSQSDGDMELHGCNAGQNDQKFYLQPVPASDLDGRTNGYLIKSADNGLCMATQDDEEIFGWNDCSTSDQGGNGDRSWLLTKQATDGFRIESARYPGWCMATESGWNLFRYPCGDKGQAWTFDPPFDPSGHGTNFTNPEGSWYLAASNNGDISKSLTIGMSWTDSTTVTNSDQVGLSYGLQMSGEFLDLGASETVSASYSHTWSDAVMASSTTTSSEQCTATCHLSDLPSDSPGWNLMQWEMRGTASKGVISTRTCDYLCLPQPMQPKCPVNCCQDRDCQTCLDCFESNGSSAFLVV
jgi:VCBS repeat-containing protein